MVYAARGDRQKAIEYYRKVIELIHADVYRLDDESGQYRTLLLVFAYTGIRWAEAVGLRVRDVEFLRRRLNVNENAVQLGVTHAVGPTKRNVPGPARHRVDGRDGQHHREDEK